jgi:hypothetical protein
MGQGQVRDVQGIFDRRKNSCPADTTAGLAKTPANATIRQRDPDDKKIITKVRLDEISLVDRPSNPEARFDVWKVPGFMMV